jgi:hypothetical protein
MYVNKHEGDSSPGADPSIFDPINMGEISLWNPYTGTKTEEGPRMRNVDFQLLSELLAPLFRGWINPTLVQDHHRLPVILNSKVSTVMAFFVGGQHDPEHPASPHFPMEKPKSAALRILTSKLADKELPISGLLDAIDSIKIDNIAPLLSTAHVSSDIGQGLVVVLSLDAGKHFSALIMPDGVSILTATITPRNFATAIYGRMVYPIKMGNYHHVVPLWSLVHSRFLHASSLLFKRVKSHLRLVRPDKGAL